MENTGKLLNSLYNDATGHATLLGRYVRVSAYRKMTDLLAMLVRSSVIFAFLLFAALFATAGAAIWIGETTGSMKTGFFIVAAAWLLSAGIIALSWRSGSARNLILRRSDAPVKDYNALRAEEQRLQVSVRESEQRIKDEFAQLRGLLAPAAPDGSATGKSPLASPAVDFILRNVVLRGAGPVKRFVVPVIANAVLNSRAMKGRKGLLSTLLRKLV